MPKPKPLHGFTPADLRAFGEGRKTQWRVPVKVQPPAELPHRINYQHANGTIAAAFSDSPTVRDGAKVAVQFCPLGTPGDRLFISEPFAIESFGAGVAQIRYAVDGHRGKSAGNSDTGLPNRLGLVPATRMPAHCARYWCEIVAVRVERVQSITGTDCKAEGFEPDWEAFHDATCNMEGWEEPEEFIEECEEECDWINFGRSLVVSSEHREWNRDRTIYALRLAYKDAWNARHGAGAWERNDFVWVIELKKVEGA